MVPASLGVKLSMQMAIYESKMTRMFHGSIMLFVPITVVMLIG